MTLWPLFLATLGGCSSELDGKPAAQVRSMAPTPGTPQPLALPESGLKVDASVSSISFVGAKVTRDHRGGFDRFEGVAVLEGEELVDLLFVVDMTSTFSDAQKLTRHLLGAEFFGAEDFPSSSFDASSISAGTPGGTHQVTGLLELRGQKKEISFPATVTVAGEQVRVQSEFTINRRLWGLDFPGKPDDLIEDAVLVQLDLRFPRSLDAD